MEEETGVKLFERGARKITLTREGKIVIGKQVGICHSGGGGPAFLGQGEGGLPALVSGAFRQQRPGLEKAADVRPGSDQIYRPCEETSCQRGRRVRGSRI